MKTNIRIIAASATLCLALPALAVFGFSKAGGQSVPPAIMSFLPFQIAATDTGSNPVDQALDAISGGHYDDGITALKAIVAKDGRAADIGANASYALTTAYQNHGDFSDSLSEAKLLLDALPKEPYSDSGSDRPSHADLDEIISSDTVIVKRTNALKAAASLSNSLSFRTATDGDLAYIADDLTGADDFYVKSYSLLAQEPNAPQSVKYFVDRRYLVGFPTNVSFDQRLPGRVALCREILHETSASPQRQVIALQFLNRTLQYVEVPHHKAANVASFNESEFTKLLESRMASTDKVLKTEVQLDMLQYTSLGHAKLANEAEAAGNWTRALSEYRTILKSFDPAMSRLIYCSILHDPIEAGEEAVRSAKYMNGITDPAVNHGACSFLGVEHTIGSDWQGVVGHEAWALFAVHGADECGGPALINGAFSYAPFSGDARNYVRRWRDPDGWMHRPTDIAVDDPLSPGPPVFSFLDDNGEVYHLGNGPDIYLNLTVPPGRHILSFPIHFSVNFPGVKMTDKFHYGILLDQQVGNVEKCVAAGTISDADEPGYVRIAVTGPANYTLAILRADCWNANLPAIFLDPDLRFKAPPSLSELFSQMELSPSADDSVTGSLKAYSVLVNHYQAGTASPSSQNWSQLQKDARTMESDKTLDTVQRTVAAYIEWRSAERCPMDVSAIETAFRDYVALKYGIS